MLSRTIIFNRGFIAASVAVLALVALAALYSAFERRWIDAAALAGMAALGFAFVGARDRLPAIFKLLFVVAAAANTAGYVFGLWTEPAWFDEVAHAYTGFAVAAAFGWLLIRKTDLEESGGSWRLVAVMLVAAFAAGILWEIFEWAIGIIDGPYDTRLDIVMDMIGAAIAGMFCAWLAGRRAKATTPAAPPGSPSDAS